MATTSAKIAHDEGVVDEERGSKPEEPTTLGTDGGGVGRNEHYRPLLISTAVFACIGIVWSIAAVAFVLNGTYPLRYVYMQRMMWFAAVGSLFLSCILYHVAICCCGKKGDPDGLYLKRVGMMTSILGIILYGVGSPFYGTVELHSVAGYILAMLATILIIPFVSSTVLLTRLKENRRRTKVIGFWTSLAIAVLIALLVIGAVVYDTSMPIDDYPNCVVDFDWWIGDGFCDGRDYASEECGYDGGDCRFVGEECYMNYECLSDRCGDGVCVE